MKRCISIVCMLMFIFALSSCNEQKTDGGDAINATPVPTGPVFEVSNTDYGKMLPEIMYEITKEESDENGITVYFEFMTVEEFEFYLSKIEAAGFIIEPQPNIDAENNVFDYTAYDEQGYEFKIHSDSEGSQMGVYVGRSKESGNS